jgi:hypothetical protein
MASSDRTCEAVRDFPDGPSRNPRSRASTTGDRQERERIHLLLIDDAPRGLADIAAGRTQDADAGIAALQARRAGAPTAGAKGKEETRGAARKRG